MFDLLALVSVVSCSVWGQRSPGGQVCFEVSAMLFGGQWLRPLPRRGSWELLLLRKVGFRGWARRGFQGLVREAGAKLVCNAVGGPGGRAARGHGHQHLGMSWGEEASLEAIRRAAQGLETGQGGLLGSVLQTLLIGGPSGPCGVGSSWGLGVYVPPRTRVREHLSRCRKIRSLPCQASCPPETLPPHLAGWLEAQWEGGAHMDILQKH